MSLDDPATLSPPTGHVDVEEFLRKLAHGARDSAWADLSSGILETILRSLASGTSLDTPGSDMTSTTAAETAVEDLPHGSEVEPSETDPVLPRLSEKTLLNVLETAPDAIVVIDRRGTIVLVNAQTEKMFGYDRRELLGKKVEILVPIRNRARHVQQRRTFFQTPHVRAMGSGLPLFGLRKDGREFPVEISLSPLEAPDGTLVTSTIRDVSEGKRREAQLRKAEARYRSLVEEIPAVTFMAALDEGINELYVSPQIVDLLGFTQQEWLDDPVLWHRQLHEEYRERWHIDFARTCATAQPFRSVYRFRARDGRVVWVHGEAKVVRDHDGRPLFLQGVAFDITARKEAEEKLQELNWTLEDRIADRTAALKRSNDALANYGGHVAHEIKRPVRRIFDVLKPLRTSAHAKDPPPKRLAKINRIADDMMDLVQNMLAYARVGEEANRFAPTDCAVLFREIKLALQKEIEAAGASVSRGSLPIVNAHRESLKSVLRNLIDNAIKYRARTARRKLRIRVSARLEAGVWQFSVRDNGEGIKERYWQSIFDLFQRNHPESIPGHGIGLSYCQKVIEHHGGKIWVESEYGKGSTFFFTLPAGLEDQGHAPT